LVGGYALYHMNSNQKDLEERKIRLKENHSSKDNVVYETKSNSSHEGSDAGREPHADSSDDETPSWMSKKDPVVKRQHVEEAWRSVDKKTLVVDDDTTSSVSLEEKDVDTDSNSSDEEYVPSWMSRKEAQTSLKEVSVTAPALTSRQVPGRQFVTSSQGLADVAYALSDVVFVYPSAGKSYFGGHAVEQAANRVRNSRGQSVEVKVMETRSGAGAAVAGAVASGTNATVLATSSTLRPMMPSMFEMAQQRLPAVFHVAAFSVGDDLAIRQDLSDVMCVRDTGFVVLASANAQEAYDFAVLSHAIAQRTSTPTLHFFDGSRGLDQHSKIRTTSQESLAKLSADTGPSPTTFAGLEAAYDGTGCSHVAKIVEQTMQKLGDALSGNPYRPFEYIGSPNAETVVVAMGSAAQVVIDAVASNVNVGVLKVRLIRPWSAAFLLHAIPESVRRVAVLDQSAERSLFLEVAASFHSKIAADRVGPAPLLLSGIILPTTEGFGPQMVASVVSNLVSEHPQANFTVGYGPTSLQADMEKISPPHQVREIVVFSASKSVAQVDTAARTVAKQLATRGEVNVQFLAVEDPFIGDGVIRTELRMSQDHHELPQSYAVQDAQVVAVEESVLETVGEYAVSKLREGGTLLVVPSSTASQRKEIPRNIQAQLARKAAHAATLNVLELLKKHVGEDNATEGALDAASMWMGFAAALQIANGPTAFRQILGHIQNALSIAKPLGDTYMELVNVLSSSLSRVEGYITQSKPNKSRLMFTNTTPFGSPVVSGSFYSYKGNTPKSGSVIDFDTQSVTSQQSFGLSPIAARPQQKKPSEFLPRFQTARSHNRSKDAATIGSSIHESEKRSGDKQIVKLGKHHVALNMIFPEAYEATKQVRPSAHGVHVVRLIKNKRLTPEDYERNIFHLEFDISGTPLKYQIGDALGVYGHNDTAEVDAFIEEYGLEPNAFVSVPSRGQMQEGQTELVSVRNLFIQHLDLFGRPSKKFYCALAGFATSRYEYLKLMHIGTDDAEAFKLGIHETVTFADLLLQYKTANPTIEDLVELIPPIKARHYSIASSMKLNPRSVHLLVVAVDWVTPRGRKRFGQCTRYLANLDPTKEECHVAVDVMPSVLRLPEDPKQPVVMAGLGTGMAPFRAFIQERKFQKEMGMEVGPMILYFGARHRHEEWLYGDEWEQYEKEGLVKLGLAFSRDQKEKVYIQHKIDADGDLLSEYLGPASGNLTETKGSFYLCGPTWPVSSISLSLASSFASKENPDWEQLEELKKHKRFVLEVY